MHITPVNSELLDTLAQLIFTTWPEEMKADGYHSWESYATHYRNQSHDTIYIAQSKTGTLLGTVSLVAHDLPEKKHLSPWIASLYVYPDYRGKGVGKKLIAYALSQCKIETVYLWCHKHMLDYYKVLGWNVIEVLPADKYVMKYKRTSFYPKTYAIF